MRFPPETVFLTVLAAAAAWAQEQPPANPAPPLLENSGKPMLLPFRCTEDDVQWAGLSCSADEPCPVYLELAAVESTAGRVFAAGHIHALDVSLYSLSPAREPSGGPFPLHPAPVAPPSVWRARADGPTQSFHVERRQGERWVSVAAFAVGLGAC